jgi:uncharacterized membrane protein
MLNSLASRINLSKHRLEALADGVFAIAATLLVLEIKIPELPRDASMAMLRHALRGEVPVIFSFFVTFIISGTFWFLHQVSFHWIHKIDRTLVFINIGLLMFVSLLPFSTGMLGHFLGNSIGQMFYFGNAFAIAIMVNLHWHYSRRANLMTMDPAEALEQSLFAGRIHMMAAAFLAAFITSFFAPRFGGFAAVVVLVGVRIVERRVLKTADAAKAAAK